MNEFWVLILKLIVMIGWAKTTYRWPMKIRCVRFIECRGILQRVWQLSIIIYAYIFICAYDEWQLSNSEQDPYMHNKLNTYNSCEVDRCESCEDSILVGLVTRWRFYPVTYLCMMTGGTTCHTLSCFTMLGLPYLS